MAPHLLTYLFFAFCFLPDWGRECESRYVMRARINHQHSSLTISGTSNLNDFACEYTGAFPLDSFTVNVHEKEGNYITDFEKISIPLIHFQCENSYMTSDFRNLLNAEKYPNIDIEIKKISRLDEMRFLVETNITIAGVTKKKNLETKVVEKEGGYVCFGDPQLDIREFNLSAPAKLFGLIRVNPKITIRYCLQLQISEV